jgi:hypothetical protein
MGLALVLFSLWCLYDGAIKYPQERQRALEDFKAQVREHHIPDVEKYVAENWDKYAEENKIRGEVDFVLQYVMAGVAGMVGLLLLSIPLRLRGKWIEASDRGVSSSWGQAFDFDQVISLDKRKWRKKGIATVTYREGDRKRRFVLDDYKFDRYPTDDILFELEQRIGVDKITGGPPEPLPDEEQSAANPTDNESEAHSSSPTN